MFGLLDVPVWITVIVILVTSFYLYTAWKHSLFRRYGIPGPKPTPFVGFFPEIMKKGVMACEAECVAKYGKCVGYFLGNLPTIFLTDPDVIREMFVKRFSHFQNRSQAAYVSTFWRRSILMSNQYDHWKFLRSTLTPSFTSGKLKKMDTLFLKSLDKTVDLINTKLESSSEIDMIPVFKAFTLDVICRTGLGVELDSKDNSHSEFRKQISLLIDFSLEKNPLLTLLFFIPEIKYICKLFDIDYNNTKARKYLEKAMKVVIETRKSEQPEKAYDILQLMLNSNIDSHRLEAQDGNSEHVQHRGMTDDEVISNAITFLFAGYDTTSTALIFASYFLATEQESQAKLVEEINAKIGNSELTYDLVNDLEYLDMFLSETMRLYPPVTRINRQTQGVEPNMGGFTYPSDISVTVPVFTLHRLPEYWPDPLKFNPQRFSEENKGNIKPYTYMPFGSGPRNCVGMRFALLELKMMMVKLLQNFKFKKSPNLLVPPQLEKNVFCRPKGGMRLLVELRNNFQS